MACIICKKPGGFGGGLYLACGACTMMVGRGKFLLPLCVFIRAISFVLSLETTADTRVVMVDGQHTITENVAVAGAIPAKEHDVEDNACARLFAHKACVSAG